MNMKPSFTSPDGMLMPKVYVNDSGELSYRVDKGNSPLVLPSKLGIKVDGIELGKGVDISVVSTEKVTGEFDWLGTSSTVPNNYVARSYNVKHRDSGKVWQLDTRIYNTGFAFRYVVKSLGRQTVNSENTTWTIPTDAELWHRINVHSYQTRWNKLKASEIKKGFKAQYNITLELADGTYAAINETGSFNFSGAELVCHGTNVLTTNFADNSKGWDIEGDIVTPWRILQVGKDLNELVNANLPAAVCPAPDEKLFPKGCKTEWIKPGKSMWQWWGYWNPGTLWERQRWFVDNAAALGCEYYLVDEGWEHPAQGWITENRTAWEALKELADYGKKRGVKLLVWRSYPANKAAYYEGMETKEKRIRFFKNCQKAGVVGCKLDFINHESVVHRTFMHECLKEAAQFEQIVNYHGSPKPMGQARTYPNEVSREGVMGMEHNKWETIPRYHYATAPFTRFLSGYADFTVTAFQPEFLKGTTCSLQLATAIAYTSPALHWADKPQFLLKSPSVDLLRSVPTTWDETIVLPCSKIGELAAFARRKGDDWYVAYINGSDEVLDENLSLSFLGDGTFSSTFYRDVTNQPAAMKKQRSRSSNSDRINFRMSPGGGFVAVFRKLDATPYGGSVYSSREVKLHFADGADVRYTLDGSEPNKKSKKYSGKFTVGGSCQLRAKVVSGDGLGTEINTYFVKLPTPEPEIELKSIINKGETVGIMGITHDSVIYYTTDGTIPTTKPQRYTGPIVLSKSCTLKAIAAIDGKTSPVVEQRVDLIPPPGPMPQIHLSDLKPVSSTIEWGTIHMNKNISGSALTVAGKVYNKGVGTHAKSEIIYQLKPNYKRFVAGVGVDDLKKMGGTINLIVKIDGKIVASTPTLKGGQLWNFNIEIPVGSQKLELIALDGGNGNNSDHVDWVNCGFMTN